MSDPQFQRPTKLALGRHECWQPLYMGIFECQATTGRAVFLFSKNRKWSLLVGAVGSKSSAFWELNPLLT